MKKLLVFTLVLCIPMLAHATLQISVDGDPNPVDSEIIVKLEQTLEIGIYGSAPASSGIYWLMIVDSASGLFSGGNPVQGASSGMGDPCDTDIFLYNAGLAPDYNGNPDLSASSGWVIDTDALSGQLVDQIDYHQSGGSLEAIVELYSSQDELNWSLEDVVIFHQELIPEPATMALLGLGGIMIYRCRVESK